MSFAHVGSEKNLVESSRCCSWDELLMLIQGGTTINYTTPKQYPLEKFLQEKSL